MRQYAQRTLFAFDQREQDNSRSDNRARLETAARTVLAVELHIQPEQQDEWNQHATHNAWNQVMPQAFVLIDDIRSLRRRRPRPSRNSTPMPAVNTTNTSPSVS